MTVTCGHPIWCVMWSCDIYPVRSMKVWCTWISTRNTWNTITMVSMCVQMIHSDLVSVRNTSWVWSESWAQRKIEYVGVSSGAVLALMTWRDQIYFGQNLGSLLKYINDLDIILLISEEHQLACSNTIACIDTLVYYNISTNLVQTGKPWPPHPSPWIPPWS